MPRLDGHTLLRDGKPHQPTGGPIPHVEGRRSHGCAACRCGWVGPWRYTQKVRKSDYTTHLQEERDALQQGPGGRDA